MSSKTIEKIESSAGNTLEIREKENGDRFAYASNAESQNNIISLEDYKKKKGGFLGGGDGGEKLIEDGQATIGGVGKTGVSVPVMDGNNVKFIDVTYTDASIIGTWINQAREGERDFTQVVPTDVDKHDMKYTIQDFATAYDRVSAGGQGGVVRYS